MWEDTAESASPSLLTARILISVKLQHSADADPDEGRKGLPPKAAPRANQCELVTVGECLWDCILMVLNQRAEIQDRIRESLLTGAHSLGTEFNFLVRTCPNGS